MNSDELKMRIHCLYEYIILPIFNWMLRIWKSMVSGIRAKLFHIKSRRRAPFIRSIFQVKRKNNKMVVKFTSINNQTISTIASRTILALNDDCLKYIFDYLALNDPLTISKCCKRFKRVVVNISVALILWPSGSLEPLEVFGRKATDLEIWEWFNNTFSERVRTIMIQKLQKQCTNIKTLTLHINTIDISSTKFFKNIASQLSLLTLVSLNAPYWSSQIFLLILKQCMNIKHLELKVLNMCSMQYTNADRICISKLLQFLKFNYPQLLTFNLGSFLLDDTPEYENMFTQFCQNHKTLIEISLRLVANLNYCKSFLDLKSLKRVNLDIIFYTGYDFLSQLLILNHHETLEEINLEVTIFNVKKTVEVDIAILGNVRALKHLSINSRVFKGMLPQILKIS